MADGHSKRHGDKDPKSQETVQEVQALSLNDRATVVDRHGKDIMIGSIAATWCAAGFNRLLCINCDAVNAGARAFKQIDLLSAKVMSKDIVGNMDLLFFLYRNVCKTVHSNQLQVHFFLNGTTNATCIHLGSGAEVIWQLTFQNNIGDTEMSAGF